jgi:hypothetical protein
LFEGDDRKRCKGFEQLAGAKQEIRIAWPTKAFVAAREGLVDQRVVTNSESCRTNWFCSGSVGVPGNSPRISALVFTGANATGTIGMGATATTQRISVGTDLRRPALLPRPL